MTTSTTEYWNFEKPPYIVLVGDVGTGKSTIVEKLTGVKGRSSVAKLSVTKSSTVLWVPDGSLIVSDTPGSNPLKDKLDHNIWIAGALNFRPVSRIFIVVKAEPRMANVFENVSKYADRFLELPMDVVGVLVTHMDMVDWTAEEFTPLINDELGINTVVFSWVSTKHETLLQSILETCTKEFNLTVNDENFLKLFKIHNSHRMILQSTSDEVKNFKEKKKAFDDARNAFNGKDLVDLVFEFQAYMTDEIAQAQKRISEENEFTFCGDGAANEAGHVANMVNQLRTILFHIRTECREYQSAHGVSELRKCPYCGIIWTKVEGCDGDTTCGNRPSTVYDFRDSAYAILGTFSFSWLGKGELKITKSIDKTAKQEQNSKPAVGCGKTINWKKMAPVTVPYELSEAVKVGTSDIELLPSTASSFNEQLSDKIDAAQRELSLPEGPSPVADPDLERPPLMANADLERPPPMADPDLDRPSPVADTDLQRPSLVADPDLEKPSPAADPDLERPSPMANADLDRPTAVADPDLERPTPVADPDLERPSPVADPDLERPTPVADPDLERPPPKANADLERPSPVADPDLERPSPVVDPDVEKPSPVADPDLERPTPVADPDLERPSPMANSDLERPSPVANPDLKLRGGPGSVLLALLVVLLSVIVFFFYPK